MSQFGLFGCVGFVPEQFLFSVGHVNVARYRWLRRLQEAVSSYICKQDENELLI